MIGSPLSVLVVVARRFRPLSTTRRGLLLGAVAVLGAGLGCASGGTTIESSPPTAPTATSTPDAGPRAAPRWEPVATFDGDATIETDAFDIDADAIQWRVRWTCATGALVVESLPPPPRPAAVVDAPCPGAGEGYSIQTGEVGLRVQAIGPWTLTVEQQVDSPLAEAPLPGMDDATPVASGEIYGIERDGRGRATLYRLPDGSAALRFDDFEVSQNTDLFVWLSEAVEPRTSVEASGPPYVEIAELKSTLGSQNYLVPDSVDLARVRSVVVWCAPVRIAYAAAPLMPIAPP